MSLLVCYPIDFVRCQGRSQAVGYRPLEQIGSKCWLTCYRVLKTGSFKQSIWPCPHTCVLRTLHTGWWVSGPGQGAMGVQLLANCGTDLRGWRHGDDWLDEGDSVLHLRNVGWGSPTSVSEWGFTVYFVPLPLQATRLFVIMFTDEASLFNSLALVVKWLICGPVY